MSSVQCQQDAWTKGFWYHDTILVKNYPIDRSEMITDMVVDLKSRASATASASPSIGA